MNNIRVPKSNSAESKASEDTAFNVQGPNGCMVQERDISRQ